ncbi:hypothetical protein PPYR_14471 [Photinus pyralis]|uniref:DNA replication ATP-dependent helicase/nuclease n=1 Tax=Photinus pyralis TaxID=7054 RepID=A0A5N4A5D1_PHOPY|nr:DNA replication ATP-dependent helicase/nuclease DNA2 [Photinus pyralis]KAB0792512.1 hypothetical protein PPYR_14471 [Photinus pyralis]
MKKLGKNKKPSKGSQKISTFFKKVSPTGNEELPNGKPERKCVNGDHDLVITKDTFNKKRKRSSVYLDDDLIECTPHAKTCSILESITNIPHSSKTEHHVYITPESRSPDIIPCSISTKELERYNKTIINRNFKVEVTPEKRSCLKEKRGSSEKKSPTKLFHKSPRSLDKFNVEMMENFVRVVPSKAECRELSPSSHTKERQKCNETTPTKSPIALSSQVTNKVKQKLTFDDCKDAVDSLLNDGWEEDFTTLDTYDHTLDLSKAQHCAIVDIQHNVNINTVVVKGTKDNKTAICDIEGFWTGLKLQVNDIVYITAVLSTSNSKWCVNNSDGSIVYHPDFLISTTSVVGSQFCSRRSVLREKFYGFEPSNQVMVVGVLVHKLLQEVLKNGIYATSEMEVLAKKLLLDRETIRMCYESDLPIENIFKELSLFVPKIKTFVSHYLKGCLENPIYKNGDWKGTISNILDIEENVWCHELGLKGKVDVTVGTETSVMPLEIKTGRATVSLEHRGQVMFYIMMLQKLGCKLSSGLLLYLREGVLREILVSEKERRDLVLLRNELAYYLTRKPKLTFDNSKDFSVQWELPEPINHHSACAKCPYNVICCTALKYEKANLCNNALKDLEENLLTHLEPAHVEYFMKWSALLTLESSSSHKSKQLHEIYTLRTAVREKNGQCIINVIVKGVNPHAGLYEHIFCKASQLENYNMLLSGIGMGDYVVVSTDNRPAVAAGFATHMDSLTISLSLDRDLKKKYPNCHFHLDTYTSSISQGFNMSNLALLLEPTDQAERLRRIVIDKHSPTFSNKLPKLLAIKGTTILRRLNKMQQKAILKSLSCNEYLLINGMPGTGKTDTIVALIKLLTELNKSVLVTSHTHSAVDNVCVRLLACGVDVLRLGSSSKIHPKLKEHSEEMRTKMCQTPEQLAEVYNSAKVLAVTCLGSGHAVLNKRVMDVCIVDESTQVLQCSVFRALYSARKFILIGDPDQLPPIVHNKEAIDGGLAESLFERLNTQSATVTLQQNYRMNKPITDMANNLTYNGQLLTANEEVANATLQFPNFEYFLQIYKDQEWILYTLDRSLSASVRILDTGRKHSDSETLITEESRCTNLLEIAILKTLVYALFEGGISSDMIGIIAPYRAQVAKLSTSLQDSNVEISTVDQFQGRDKEIIFYSCTRSGSERSIGSQPEILDDKRRLTVAITRAKYKFIMIGDLSTIRQYQPFENLLGSTDPSDILKLTDGELGFNRKLLII